MIIPILTRSRHVANLEVTRWRVRPFATGLLVFAALPLLSGGARPGLACKNTDSPSNEASKRCPSRLYILAVGVDDYDKGRLEYAASDAHRLADRLQHDWPSAGADTLWPVTQIVLTDRAASREAIVRAFEAAVRDVKERDVFVFYFAGRSFTTGDSSAPLTQLLLHGADWPYGGLRTPLPDSVAIATRQLKLWLDNIAANRQLIVLDAGRTRGYMEEFVTTFTEADPLAASLTRRNRVIVAPRSFGAEAAATGGGLLTYLLVQSRVRIPQGVFDLDARRFELDLSARTYDDSSIFRTAIAGGGLYVGVYYEREVLQLLRRAARQLGADTAGLTRGVSLAPTSDRTRRLGVGRGVALVIGTGSYDAGSGWQALPNPEPDARALADELRESYGYETRLLLDPTRKQIQAALRDLQQTTFDSTDEVLIFIAGHGFYKEGMNMGFLVTRDSRALTEDEFLDTYLSYGVLAPWINNIPSKHILVVIDACFGGTFDQDIKMASHRGGEDPYHPVPPEELVSRRMQFRTRQYLTSGGKEYVPDGRPGMHSPFTARLLAVLRDPGPDGVLTMNRLRAALETVNPEPRSGGFGDDEPGSDFVLVPRATGHGTAPNWR